MARLTVDPALKGMTDEEFVAARAFAPFEVAEVFSEWARRTAHARHDGPDSVTAFGVDIGFIEHNPAESFDEYGRRCAVALFTLIKEV